MHRVRTKTRNARQGRARGAHAAERHRSGLGRLLALLLLVPVFAVQATTTAASAAVVAGFEIDGDTPVNEGGLDWATTGERASDPVGNVDTSTFKGSKEFEHPSTWEIGTGLAPNQDDISDVYVHDAIVDEDIWGFIGFRRYTTSGVTNFDVEFNRQENAGGSTYLPVRSVGDVMVRFEQDGNKGFKLTNAYFWRLETGPDWNASCLEVSGYSPGAGWCPVDIAQVPFTGTTGEGGLFGEGAFNFTALLELGGGDITCLGGNFGTMNIRTFTGNANESALKDYVDAVSIDVGDTCGAMEIYKVDQFGNPVPGATFSISPNPIPGATESPLVITEGGAGDPDGTADGAIIIEPAVPGEYVVVETAAPDGYELPQPESARTWTVTVGEDGVGSVNTPLTVTDRRYFAAPTIVNAPTYDVDYNWLVTKSVAAPKTVNVPEGTPASFDYEVRLEALDPTRSDFGGTVTVTNPNPLPMVGTLSAEITGGAACSIDAEDQSGAPGLQVDLASGANPLTYTCPTAALPGGTTATVTWAEATYPSSDPAETYTRSDAKAFAIDQRTDETTTVTDTFHGGAAEDLGTFDWSTVRASEDPAAHTVVVDTYSRSIDGVPGECEDYTNTARESADDTSDSETVTVCVGRNLDVTKDANLGYQRELLWDIAKSGPGTVWVGEDENGDLRKTVDFTIDVTADGVSDSEWALTGTILIDNPNDWPVTVDVTDTVVVDTKVLQCTIDGGASVAVPANAVDHPVTYDCPGVEQGDYVGENTVTIDWSDDPYAYPRTSDSATVDVEVTGDPEPTNATVTLTDLLEGEDVTADLPQATFDWETVHAMDDHTQSLTYSVELDGATGECVPYENVVTIDQTKQSDSHTVTLCSPGVAKTVQADFGRKQLWSLTKDVDKTFVEVGPDGQARFNYTVTATPGDVVWDGTASWSGAITVSNPSDEVLVVDVADLADVEGWTCEVVDDATGVEIAAGGSVELAYECEGSGKTSGTNTAQVSFGDEVVTETVDVEFAPRPGITDSTTTLVDDIPNDGVPAKEFDVDAADGPDVFTYSRDLGAPAGACETYTNTAVLALTGEDLSADRTVRVCEEAPLEVAVEGAGSYGITYPWTIEKEVDRTRVEVDAETGEADFTYVVTVRAGDRQPAGWTLTGDVTVTNPNTYAEGDIEITDLDVSTDVGGGAVCTATLPAEPVVAHGDDLVVGFACEFSGEPATSGTVTADVSWDPAGAAENDTASGSGDVTLTVGEEVDRTIEVWDDQTDPENPVLLDGELEWAEDLVETYEYTLTHEGVPGQCVDLTNTAWLELAGENPSDSTTVTVCTEAPLELAPTATADLARDYAWSIGKVADATQRTADASGNATFTYTVTARAGDATDSGWRLQGSVEITNPNTYADGDITADVTAATDLGGGAVCTVTGGSDVVIGDDSSATLPIACTFASKPAGSGTLSVTATWDPPGEASSTSVTETTGPITFGVRSETNKTVQVVDDKTVAGQRVVLDPALTWAAGLVKSYTYDLTLAGGAPGACQGWTNTATIDLPVGTDPTATAAVLVCTPAAEVLPEQAFGKAVGSVKATCQGTVRAKLANRSGDTVVYKLRVGKKVHRITVKSLAKKKFVTKGKPRAKVTLKVGSTRLDKLRIPALCAAPEVLPDTGLRGTGA
ncbi:hypothetical protein GCM10011376_02980 [Nocardioides flavus (ex Wang et al. 2016)]|uniref:SpaA-like prealbumin fold domain-containing protein n=1 Tax=Nocardioides flavus (ex Wang et al. 2016) TaxID=2058780 RepID=A0ABQ3HDP5_9ACTN|nr:prealbumin-like fold domain-containing protein [Nocardioides flavus (ex Wang et al. 2016)]GHE15324.1 hypothetical protein GCM10011376_02980 [Nocardioides flavus (ex Wang et al. 2016)]